MLLGLVHLYGSSPVNVSPLLWLLWLRSLCVFRGVSGPRHELQHATTLLFYCCAKSVQLLFWLCLLALPLFLVAPCYLLPGSMQGCLPPPSATPLQLQQLVEAPAGLPLSSNRSAHALCLAMGGHWHNAPFNFDTVANGCATLFVMGTSSSWSQVLADMTAARGAGTVLHECIFLFFPPPFPPLLVSFFFLFPPFIQHCTCSFHHSFSVSFLLLFPPFIRLWSQ